MVRYVYCLQGQKDKEHSIKVVIKSLGHRTIFYFTQWLQMTLTKLEERVQLHWYVTSAKYEHTKLQIYKEITFYVFGRKTLCQFSISSQ